MKKFLKFKSSLQTTGQFKQRQVFHKKNSGEEQLMRHWVKFIRFFKITDKLSDRDTSNPVLV